MPTELTTLSQSSLQDYNDCPRRFDLRYLQQLAYPAIEAEPALENEQHQREGEYFHRLIQQYFIGIPEKQLAKAANTDSLERWWTSFINTKKLTALRNLSGLKTEITLSAPLGAFRLVAKYDLIATDEKKFYIYDWKTYRKRPKTEWLAIRWQTRIYRALLVQAGAHLNGGAPIQPEQIEMIGNSSLAGAYLTLLDSSALCEIRRLSQRMQIVELNLEPEFEWTYIDQLVLPS